MVSKKRKSKTREFSPPHTHAYILSIFNKHKYVYRSSINTNTRTYRFFYLVGNLFPHLLFLLFSLLNTFHFPFFSQYFVPVSSINTHTHTHAHTHTHTHTHIHSYTRTHIYTNTHTYKQIRNLLILPLQTPHHTPPPAAISFLPLPLPLQPCRHFSSSCSSCVSCPWHLPSAPE